MAFVANGLLGSGLSANEFEDTETSTTSCLQPNGLFGTSSLLSIPSSLQDPETLGSRESASPPTGPIANDETIDRNEGALFQSNGLLGATLLNQNDTSLLPSWSEAQPGGPTLELPTIAQFFGAPTGLLEAPVSPAPSTSQQINATTFEGRILHLRRKIKRRSVPSASSEVQKMGNLIDVPIHRLLERLSHKKAEQLQFRDLNSQHPSTSTSATEEELWVDRYRPRKFTELLGNERVAREAMAWVKQWDWCVFGRKKAKKRGKGDDESTMYQDEYHRPPEKFLLLSGPPGLGKTTLAHVIARQAGYEVMEINASDARSGHIVDERIRPTLEAGSTVGSSKPVLLVIDEIDGATGAGDSSNTFIHKLVQLIQAKPKKKQRNGKRDPHSPRPILRPIICICNDLNASSIAKLRPHAFQVRFTKPSDIHSVRRLREVCEIEGLKADSRALSTLVGIARGDLRGCLNTLQFLNSKTKEITETTIRKATLGMKEGETSVQTVLNNLFNPLSKKRVQELGLTEAEEAKYVARLCIEIDGCGRENAVAIGCFGHYVTLRHHDANLSRHEQGAEWLTTFDLLSTSMYSDGDFTLHQYLPYTLVPFFPLFQERGGERVDRSQTDWEHIQTTRTNEEIYKSLSRSLRSAAVRHGGDFRHLGETPVLHLEFAPLLNRIISPPLRPVNSQVIKADERAVLTRLVDLMASLELRFVRERGEDGQLSYRLDPPIDVFMTYDGKRASDISVSRYAVRHLVASEVDAKLAEKDTEIVEKGKRGKHSFFGQRDQADSVSKRSRDKDDEKGEEHPSKRQKTEGPPTDIADKPPTDFFGRLITVRNSKKNHAPQKISHDKPYRVSYRFAEGNSAAVRKPVKVAVFL